MSIKILIVDCLSNACASQIELFMSGGSCALIAFVCRGRQDR